MAQSKKEKRQRRKERHERLRAVAEQIHERLLADAAKPREEVAYVLDAEAAREEGSEEEAQRAQGELGPGRESKDGGGGGGGGEEDEEDTEAEEERVELPPSAAGVASAALRKAQKASAAGRKHRRMTWQSLKLAVTDRYGAEVAERVSEHDGNAEDPLFTVWLKAAPHTVPVPRHWDRLRSFLSLQADREEAVGLVPPEIQALGVDKMRASKDKRVNPDQVAFMTCFITGTPLQRRTFQVELTPFGDVFREGKWIPKARFEPGKLSQRLRQALGMGPHAPPPWLYSMQAMRRLPPAYPRLRVPGLNAPIPAGAQWGRGLGQWGDPPRGEHNNFLFPSLMDESAASVGNAPKLWGVVPPLEGEEEVERRRAAGDGGSPHPPPVTAPRPSPAAAPAPAPAPAKKVVITPTPFRPQVYQPQVPVTARYVSSTPQEYVRVQDSSVGSTVAVGHRMILKGSVAHPGPAAAQPAQPAQPAQASPPPPRQPAKQPPPPNPRSNRGTKF